jgi:hypothetical protein
MSQPLISRSPDLTRLQDEGYEVEVRDGYVLIHSVPYVDSSRRVRRGVLVTSLTLAGDTTARPQDHVVQFAGEMPCDQRGHALSKIYAGGGNIVIGGLRTSHMFSSKPPEGYSDYFEKMSSYVNILSGPAQALDPAATAVTFGVTEQNDPESVFKYMETASSRAGISAAMAKLREHRLAIVGLGGTGAYVLDYLAKTPAQEIHLFDGDNFLQHNAFRSPGAASIEELWEQLSKVEYFRRRYAPMRGNIFAHEFYVDAGSIEALRNMDFVFICIDSGAARRLLVETLQSWGTPFIDVGMGIFEKDGALGGQIRTTTSSGRRGGHVAERLPFAADEVANEYRQNIQIADLNALNAALAVIRWKRLVGFYIDLEDEHHSIYAIDGNHLLNEERPEHGEGTDEAAA